MAYPKRAIGSKTKSKKIPADVREDDFALLLEYTPKRYRNVDVL